MLKTEVHKVIDQFRIKVGDDEQKNNVLSQAGIQCRAGKWQVPDDKYKLFLDTINKTITKNPKAELYFLEVPKDTSNMVKVDIDLRFKATEEELKQKSQFKRRYTEDFIESIVDILASKLGEIINIPDNYKIYVQEKKNPRISYKEKQIKDGIHIIIPELVLSNKALYYLREQIVGNEDLETKLKEMENSTTINDVIDKRIIYPNAWYIYGCGKPDDKGDFYKITRIYKVVRNDDDDSETGYDLKMVQTNKTYSDYLYMFSNFEKEENVEYIMNFDDDEYQNDDNTKFTGKENESIYRLYTQDQGNFRKASTLTQEEIQPYIECLKPKRADDYEDWRRIGLSLYNMDHRNFDLWKKWSSKSPKYSEQVCLRSWYKEFPKASKYNLGLNKIREYAKQDNPEMYKKIINVNKNNFFLRWLQAHVNEKDIHNKSLSISTITKFIHSYIMDYANFNIACALPGGASSVYYKFEKHKWSEDKGANKIYNLLSDTIKNEINTIYLGLKEKLIASQRSEHERTRMRNRTEDDDDGESVASYQRFIVDDREHVPSPEEQANEQKTAIYNKLQYEKCGALIQFLDAPRNKKTIIEDLSQKCYDEEFYKKLDENVNVFVCTNGVLDLDTGIFRDGQPSDMMTMSCNIEFPTNPDSPEAQEIMYALQDWLDKIFPDDEVQAYVLNTFACKLSGKLFGEKFHIFTGTGANGKSQFFKMIKEVFGDYFHQSDNTLLNTPKRDANSASPAMAVLKCKHIVVMSEPKNNIPFESDKVKELVSGDPLTCRHLNKDPIQFIPQYMMFLQCNDIPRNESTDDGFWRKIFIVPCEAKFVIKDEDMHKLNDPVKFPYHFKGQDQSHLYKDWAPYLLYLLFERFKELKDNDFKYPVPEKMKAATKQYMEEASTYTQFFREKLEEAPGYKVDAATLYLEFQQFVGRDFKTHKPTFLKQMERVIGKPKGKNKEYFNYRISGTTGEQMESTDSNNVQDAVLTDPE